MNSPSTILLSVCLLSSCAGTPAQPIEPALEPGFVRLISPSEEALGLASTIEGWRVLGKADFSVSTSNEADSAGDVQLTGHAEKMRQNSFLVSEAEYADFELLVDVRIEAGGNSGVQIRSHADWEARDGHGKLWGYQIEIDPSERAWSGGLYDEGRRGWLFDLKELPEARAAFTVGEWNEYRILCEGPRIRTWLNGVPAVDFTDEGKDLTLSGHIAFQVHGGDRSHVEWRNPRIRTF